MPEILTNDCQSTKLGFIETERGVTCKGESMFFSISKGSRKSLEPRGVLQQGTVFIFNFPLHVASSQVFYEYEKEGQLVRLEREALKKKEQFLHKRINTKKTKPYKIDNSFIC